MYENTIALLQQLRGKKQAEYQFLSQSGQNQALFNMQELAAEIAILQSAAETLTSVDTRLTATEKDITNLKQRLPANGTSGTSGTSS